MNREPGFLYGSLAHCHAPIDLLLILLLRHSDSHAAARKNALAAPKTGIRTFNSGLFPMAM
jgi:hypothetical protein